MNGRIWMASVAGILGTAWLAEAHLAPGSLTILGGEKFKIGETVSVKWGVNNTHAPGKFDLKVSTNGGTSFELIETKTFPLSPGEYTYAWTIPNKPSTTAQFQVCQYDGVVQCTGVYVLKSNSFTIEASTSISVDGDIKQNPGIVFNPSTRNLDVSFELGHEETVHIQALDIQGKEIASLLKGVFPSGSHKKSLHAQSLSATSPLIFQVTIGNRVYSNRWKSIR